MHDPDYDDEDAVLEARAMARYDRDLAGAADELVRDHRADPMGALEAMLVSDCDGGRMYVYQGYHMPEPEIRRALRRAMSRDPYRPAT